MFIFEQQFFIILAFEYKCILVFLIFFCSIFYEMDVSIPVKYWWLLSQLLNFRLSSNKVCFCVFVFSICFSVYYLDLVVIGIGTKRWILFALNQGDVQ